LNEIKEFGVWRYKIQFSWHDLRLKWPKECQKEKVDTTEFVEAELMDVLWNPVKVYSDITYSNKAEFQQTIQLNQVR